MTSLIKQWKQTWCHFDSLMTDMQVSTKYIYIRVNISTACVSEFLHLRLRVQCWSRRTESDRNFCDWAFQKSLSEKLEPNKDGKVVGSFTTWRWLQTRTVSLSLSPSGPWTQVFLISCMTAMVVLWPKMKAPQINVTTPQTVRTTLDRREESLTFDLNCESFSDLVIQSCNNNSSPQGGNKVISVAKMFVYHTGLVLHASSSLQSKDSDAFTVVRKRTKCHIIHFWLNLHEAGFFIWKLLLCLCYNWLLILRLAFGNN